MKKLFLAHLILFTFLPSSWALEDDRRMIVRVLGVSSSKKTILINRGREEGVKMGDHAKFSTPKDGYFARGVVSRVSPTRSVWSLYRIINEKPIIENAVITVKAASQVKLTKDESKALGILASSYTKSAYEDPTAEDQKIDANAEKMKQEEEKKNVTVNNTRNMKYKKGVNYESLNEIKGDGKNKTIDWRGVDGELDDIKNYEDVDYSGLNEKVRDW